MRHFFTVSYVEVELKILVLLPLVMVPQMNFQYQCLHNWSRSTSYRKVICKEWLRCEGSSKYFYYLAKMATFIIRPKIKEVTSSSSNLVALKNTCRFFSLNWTTHSSLMHYMKLITFCDQTYWDYCCSFLCHVLINTYCRCVCNSKRKTAFRFVLYCSLPYKHVPGKIWEYCFGIYCIE